MTPTAAVADIILPAATNFEFNDLGYYGLPWGRVYARPKLVNPVGQCWSDIKIMNELAKRVGLEEYFWEDIDRCLDYILEPAGFDYESFKNSMSIDTSEITEHKGFRTRSGKIELYSNMMDKWGLSPLPVYKKAAVPDDRYPYLLTSSKDLPFFHTSLRNITSLRKMAPRPEIQIHPELAAARDLLEGDLVSIETPTGEIKQHVKLNGSLDPRVVHCAYGWWFPEKGSENMYGWEDANINMLTDDGSYVEPLIGTTTLRGMYCAVKKAL
jgi:anaerobic selenocysteine-containing dehydrogenase